jgi:hypothetical protein
LSIEWLGIRSRGEPTGDRLDGSIMTPSTTIGGAAAVVLYSRPEEFYQTHQTALTSLGGTATQLGTDPGRDTACDVALLDLFWTTMSGYTHALASEVGPDP